MSDKKGVGWYELPKEYRNQLVGKSKIFEEYREFGTWIYPLAEGMYDPEVCAVIRCNHVVWWETMVRFADFLKSGEGRFRIAIVPVGMKIIDIVFCDKKEEVEKQKNE